MGLCRVRSCRSHGCVRFVDQSDSEAFKAALEDVPALVLIETHSNPLMRVVDISVLSGLAKEAGAAVAVDNTFLSTAIQKPISLGADYVVHSKIVRAHVLTPVTTAPLVCRLLLDKKKK